MNYSPMFLFYIFTGHKVVRVAKTNLCSVECDSFLDMHSPSRLNLAPEAEGFIYVEFALSCQGSENVLLQPDGLCSVPAVGWLLSATDISSVYGTELQTRARRPHLLKCNLVHKVRG